MAAQELGFFSRHGVAVRLCREVGWATIREKLTRGELEAAAALAPMLWAMALGIGCTRCVLSTHWVLSTHGTALTVSRALGEAAWDGAALRAAARDRGSERPLTFGVVFRFSSHHLLLRNWLRRAGLEVDRDVRVVTVPPGQMYRNLAAGTIDGYASGEPWNSLAVRQGAGFCPDYLPVPVTCLLPGLVGPFQTGRSEESVPDFHVFSGINEPSLAKAQAVQDALVDAGLVPALMADSTLPAQLFRPRYMNEIHQTDEKIEEHS